MTFYGLECFMEIVKAGSVTRAAEHLRITQSSLSGCIRALEEEVGARLLVRGKGRHSVEMTSEGERFHALAGEILARYREMGRLGGGGERARLRLAGVRSVNAYLLQDTFRRFIECAPETQLVLEEWMAEGSFQALGEGRLDACIGWSYRRHPELRAQLLFEEEFLLVSSRLSPLPEVVPEAALDLQKEIYNGWCSEFRAWHEARFGEGRLPPIRQEIYEQLPYYFQDRDCWALVPASIVHSDFLKDLIQVHRPEFPLPRRHIYLFTDPGRGRNASVERFLSSLLQVWEEKGCPGVRMVWRESSKEAL